MKSLWRLLDSGPGAGAWNMALDQALLEQAAAGDAAPILRFYSWQQPTLSLGRLQQPGQELLRRCADLGVPAVRRPTGGAAILHYHEVTFSIIAPAHGLGSVMESYRVFARAIAAGLRRLRVEAQLMELGQTAPRKGLLCFAAPAQCDLEVGGRKLLGSAQARHAGVLLQQNSLPLRLHHQLKGRLFGPAAARESRVATDLTSGLGREPTFAEVRDAIIAGFEEQLGAHFEPGWPGAQAVAAAQGLQASFRL